MAFLVLPTDFTYYLIASEATASRPNSAAFFDWMIAETNPPARD